MSCFLPYPNTGKHYRQAGQTEDTERSVELKFGQINPTEELLLSSSLVHEPVQSVSSPSRGAGLVRSEGIPYRPRLLGRFREEESHPPGHHPFSSPPPLGASAIALYPPAPRFSGTVSASAGA